ncbi:MAG: chorismate synthase [Rhodospirillaceae bacterium]|jgi:chorismate synthase|nr:chorismate synthase [Rhodospirillaceae bacterium]MBT5244160.1 chorismate synthase [Rhodospirillaceae bacterium]MBT5561685.1 chorismate synthase [Rhodospirillaceae bacterium]MBT6243124.1 chorismate synthase [Rhodospirillaceae bacterium]MBT7137882.1 chorismate synthase [Rhodospirillaceae bacterium]
MSGNTFGQLFSVTSFGESHGPAIGCIIDGVPPRIALSETDIQPHVDKRRPGQSKFTTQRQESDTVEILSGVFEGQTTGSPIALMIRNEDQRSKDYSDIKDKFRPGHADFTYFKKFGIRDYRGGGRSSARETAMRVAAGAIARKVLNEILGAPVDIRGAMVQMGPNLIDGEQWDWDEVDNNPFFCPDAKAAAEWEIYLDNIRKQGSSTGAVIEISANGIPAGLGEPVFDRLDADIAGALMSIPAVKGVEIGAGFAAASLTGPDNADEMRADEDGQPMFLSNNAGGVLGGISSGQDIIARFAVKPTSSISIARQSVNENGEDVDIVTKGRHDPCVGIRAVPVGEAMLALVLVDHLLRFRAQCGL